ncbi:hypothetical protein OGAPHI_001716 [Ogataea philodendri]|uniref:Protein STE50 n=1 Tax=Ogataea philodendri TaxID=1378263 RepID=A0A9P8PAV2_9ASCO|nr:uncharacterized protein OGAPHI_001716 [Ogataea philodendri]KAH3667962.1 hypothetical protein OGAPHI_001716 [Ogataea philodendri]
MSRIQRARPSSIVLAHSNRDIASNDIVSWNNDQVLLWLKNKQYTIELIDLFKTHNITGMTLPFLNTEELREMGINQLNVRLKLMADISDLLMEKNMNLLRFNTDPLAAELQTLVISTNIVSTIANSVTEGLLSSNGGSTRKLTDQFNKLKEDLLPVLKEIKDKKPLPTPDRVSPSQISHHQNQLQSTIVSQSIPAQGMLRKQHSAPSSSGLRKSLSSPPIISPILPEQAQFGGSQTNVSTHSPRSPSKQSSTPTIQRMHKPNRLSSSTSMGTIPTMTSANASSDPLKQLRVKTEDSCYKILQAAMKRHNLHSSDWKKYALVIVYGGDQERVLGYDEKPVVAYRELQELGLNPSIMLRQVEESDDLDSMNYETPGGRL